MRKNFSLLLTMVLVHCRTVAPSRKCARKRGRLLWSWWWRQSYAKRCQPSYSYEGLPFMVLTLG